MDIFINYTCYYLYIGPLTVIVSVVVVTAAVDVPVIAMAPNGVLADQTPDGKHRLGWSAATAAPASVVAAVVGVASAARTGPRAQIHDYGGAMVSCLRSNHRVDGASGAGPDGADDIYRGWRARCRHEKPRESLNGYRI